jgi:hypothetical protein
MTTALYAIAIKDALGLHLVARVARRPSGIYYLIPRDAKSFQIDSDENWDPHASYHVDGTHHVKSFGQILMTRTKRQPLDNAFSGAEPLFAQSFQSGDLQNLSLLSNASVFADVFAIPADRITSGNQYALAVDLLASGARRFEGPWLEAVLEYTFKDALPWIHATLWRGLRDFKAP